MRPLLFALSLAIVAGGCAWPPKPGLPATPSPGATAQQQTEQLPRVEAPRLPSVSPPTLSVPRAGGPLL